MTTTTRWVRALVLASSLTLPFGVAVWATAVEAQTCANAFPATGQTTSYATSTSTTTGAPVNDDGAVRAGGALRYQDNGDGTITDLNTQLMWEKKSSRDGSLHDVRLTFAWSSEVAQTMWDWVARVNAENGVGFAGYNDWRIPNEKELQSIVDYGTYNPAVNAAFNDGGTEPCTVLTCSRTISSGYWTATTYAADPTLAWDVDFYSAGLGLDEKYIDGYFVRAVRGGCLPVPRPS
jgi:uncharacterized protein DUF1566